MPLALGQRKEIAGASWPRGHPHPWRTLAPSAPRLYFCVRELEMIVVPVYQEGGRDADRGRGVLMGTRQVTYAGSWHPRHCASKPWLTHTGVFQLDGRQQ